MEILGYDLTEEQWARVRASMNVPEPVTNENRPVDTKGIGDTTINYEMARDFILMERHAKGNLKKGKPAASNFKSEVIPPGLLGAVQGALETAETAEDVSAIIQSAWARYP